VGASSEVDIDLLAPNPYQPRTSMDEDRLDELARSVRANGVIQPILVRRLEGGRFEIVAGERRWRAAQRAGLLKVPVVVRDVPESRLLEYALVENLVREGLNPIEEAEAYRRLAEEFGLRQDDIAAAVGKDRSSVANCLRLLKLPEEVRAAVAAGALTMGHARALLSLEDEAAERRTGREVVARDLSVRATEQLVKRLMAGPASTRVGSPERDVHTRAAEDRLRLALGTRVRIVRARRGGRIEVAFSSEEELNRLYDQLVG
jgi:ParB family chromosome partitioning protein